MLADAHSTAGQNLLSPPILFFLLGLIAALVRSDLSIPEAFAKGISLFLILAIGFKGGSAVAVNGLDWQIGLTGLAGMGLSFAMPYLAFALLRRTTGLSHLDAAAVAAHYGSVSLVTFIAASTLLTSAGIASSGAMVTVLAVMETPAILAGLLIARRAAVRDDRPTGKTIMHEVFLNGAVVLLLGAFAIGALTGQRGLDLVAPLVVAPFQGVLCIFLLDMGLIAGARMAAEGRRLGAPTIAFGLYMPLIGAAVGTALAAAIGLSMGDALLFITLVASASYIAVPAAMRLALPQADAGIYLTLTLGVTFPFNLTLGIPLYALLARLIQPGG